MAKLLYNGPASIYLEGEKALWFLENMSLETISYAIGSIETPIVVHDHRSLSVTAAFQTNTDKGQKDFADHFNQAAWVQIREFDNNVEIDLEECKQEAENKTLWLGIICDNNMPVYRTLWQKLHPVGEKSIAFAALVDS